MMRVKSFKEGTLLEPHLVCTANKCYSSIVVWKPVSISVRVRLVRPGQVRRHPEGVRSPFSLQCSA